MWEVLAVTCDAAIDRFGSREDIGEWMDCDECGYVCMYVEGRKGGRG
jgi:hypothetical protein